MLRTKQGADLWFTAWPLSTSAQRLGFKPVKDWLADVPADAWRRLSAGDGAKGPWLYDWAYLPYRADAAAGWEKGLLIRRTIKTSEGFTFT